MKTTFTRLLTGILVLCSLSLTAQVPNGSFENWTLGDPDEWITNNVQGFVTPITQETSAHGGSFALRGEVVSYTGGVLAPGITSTDTSGTGFPVNQTYVALNFYYQLSTTTTIMAVATYMVDSAGAVVGSGARTYSGTVSSYTFGTVPINYFGGTPRRCVISMLLTDTVSGTPTVGDYFIIDEMSLSTTPIGIEEGPQRIAQLYPNPANSSVAILLDEALIENGHVSLYDLQGRLVKRIHITEPTGSKLDIPTGDLPPGIYSLQLRSGVKQWNSKLVVAR